MLGPPHLAGDHQIRRLENAEMVHHPEPRHVGEVLAELAERPPVLLEQQVEQEPAAGVVERPEHLVHARDYM